MVINTVQSVSEGIDFVICRHKLSLVAIFIYNDIN